MMLRIILLIVSKAYIHASSFCFFLDNSIHCKILVAKNTGKDKRRILIGTVAPRRPCLIKPNNTGETNHIGTTTAIPRAKKDMPYNAYFSFTFLLFFSSAISL